MNWLWSTLIQAQLDKLRTTLNNHRPRKNKLKFLPSGVSPHIAYTLYEDHNGVNCLQQVDMNVVDKLMQDLGGADAARFVSAEYEERARQIFTTLGIGELTIRNVWRAFVTMLPRTLQ